MRHTKTDSQELVLLKQAVEGIANIAARLQPNPPVWEPPHIWRTNLADLMKGYMTAQPDTEQEQANYKAFLGAFTQRISSQRPKPASE